MGDASTMLVVTPKGVVLNIVRGTKLAGFSEGSMGPDIHPFPEGAESGLMDVSASNTKFMSAPASGPYEYDLAKIQQFVQCDGTREAANMHPVCRLMHSSGKEFCPFGDSTCAVMHGSGGVGSGEIGHRGVGGVAKCGGSATARCMCVEKCNKKQNRVGQRARMPLLAHCSRCVESQRAPWCLSSIE